MRTNQTNSHCNESFSKNNQFQMFVNMIAKIVCKRFKLRIGRKCMPILGVFSFPPRIQNKKDRARKTVVKSFRIAMTFGE